MADELNLDSLVQSFEGQGYSLLERIILSHDGTVQALLSIIWQQPVTVRVVEQVVKDGLITRLVDLEARDLVVARARSRIPVDKNGAQVVDQVLSGSLGLGQVAVVMGENPRRSLLEHGAYDHTFWRRYAMAGGQLYWEIQEMFPRSLYAGLMESWRWPRMMERAMANSDAQEG